jgi:hypothetical protein
MNLQEGLLPHEIIFLYLGILLFLVLLFVLVYYVIQSRKIKSLPFFFVIPIIMIGWPSIEKIKFSGALGNIEMDLRELAGDPNNSKLQDDLAKSLSWIEERPISSPTTLLTIADAHAALGDTSKALTYVDRVLTAQPKDTAAVNRKVTLLLKRPPTTLEKKKIKMDLNKLKTK